MNKCVYCGIEFKPHKLHPNYIEELYDLAKRRKLEVDHIIPVKHKLVCGLHVPWNLQLLTRSENAKKSNKFNVDYSYTLGE